MSILSKLSKTLVAASVACSFATSAMVAEAAT